MCCSAAFIIHRMTESFLCFSQAERSRADEQSQKLDRSGCSIQTELQMALTDNLSLQLEL